MKKYPLIFLLLYVDDNWWGWIGICFEMKDIYASSQKPQFLEKE